MGIIFQEKLGRKGFTLIELLVVISIVGLISTAAVIGINTVRAKARDGLRKANADQIKKALELYYNGNGQTYPLSVNFACLSASSPAGLGTYINPVPIDPIPARNTIALGCPNYQSDGLGYKLRMNLELDSDAMIGDGGTSASWFEIYSPGAQSW